MSQSNYDWKHHEEQKMKRSDDFHDYISRNPERVKEFSFFSGIRRKAKVIQRSQIVAERQDSSL